MQTKIRIDNRSTGTALWRTYDWEGEEARRLGDVMEVHDVGAR